MSPARRPRCRGMVGPSLCMLVDGHEDEHTINPRDAMRRGIVSVTSAETVLVEDDEPVTVRPAAPPAPTYTIPEARFDSAGQYKLDTERDRFAAAVSALRAIATVPIAYHSRGAEFQVEEMTRRAVELLRALKVRS